MSAPTLEKPRTPVASPRGTRRRPLFLGFTGVVSLLVAVVVAYPLLALLLRVFTEDGQFTLSAFGEAVAEPNIVGIILNTFIVVTLSVVGAGIVGTTFAWLNERTDARMGWATDMLPIVPLLVPPIAGAVGWVLLASPRAGYLNVFFRGVASWFGIEMAEGPLTIGSWYGLVFIYTLYLVPHIYINVSAGLRNLDPSMEEAARVSGASVAQVMRRITLPSIKPAITGGVLLALVYGFALFSVPAIVGTLARIEVLTVRIVRLMTATFPGRIDVAVVLGMIIVAVIGSAWLLQRRLVKAGHYATIGGRGSHAAKVRLGVWRTPARALMVAYLVCTSVLPLAGLLFVALQPFWNPSIDWSSLSLSSFSHVLFERRATSTALTNSLTFGVVTATIGMLVALLVAVRLQHRPSGLLSVTADGATKLPGAVSNIVVALGILAAFAGSPFGLSGTATILVLSYMILYMPQATVTAQSAVTQLGPEMSEAALMAGATHGRIFRRITLPLTMPGLTAGWALVFVLAAGDITASALLAGTRNPVVGFVILELWGSGTYPQLAALATLISLLTSTVVLTALVIGRRSGFTQLASKG